MVKTSSATHTMSGEYCSQQPFHFIDNQRWTPPAVGHAEHLMAAPAAFVRAAARGDERYRALPMCVSPGANISPNVDRVASRPRLCVEIRDLGARSRLPHHAVFVKKSDAGNLRVRVGCPCLQGIAATLPW